MNIKLSQTFRLRHTYGSPTDFFFIHIMLNCNENGELNTSIGQLEEEFGFSRQQVRNMLKILINNKDIAYKSGTKGGIQISIMNLKEYGFTTKDKEKVKQKSTLLKDFDSENATEKMNEYFKIALAFQDLFLSNFKSLNVPTKDIENADSKWVDDIKLMLENDGYTKNDLISVFNYLKVNDFWKSKIRTTKKLREKMQTLITRAKVNENNKQQSGTGTTDYELANIISQNFAIDREGK